MKVYADFTICQKCVNFQEYSYLSSVLYLCKQENTYQKTLATKFDNCSIAHCSPIPLNCCYYLEQLLKNQG